MKKVLIALWNGFLGLCRRVSGWFAAKEKRLPRKTDRRLTIRIGRHGKDSGVMVEADFRSEDKAPSNTTPGTP